MPADRAVIKRAAAVALAIIGAWVIWQSTVWGIGAFDGVVARFEGGLSGEAVRLAYEGPVAAIRTIGAILMAAGLWRALHWPDTR